MGTKQKAFIAAVVTAESHCDEPMEDLAHGIAGIQKLDEMILHEANAAKKENLAEMKAPFGTRMLKGRAKLETALPAFRKSVEDLDKFIKSKSKRWVGKGTLPDAVTVHKNAAERLKSYEDLVKVSKKLSLVS